jgi:hypothetical protein
MKQVSSAEARRKLKLNENASGLFKCVHTGNILMNIFRLIIQV